MRRIGLTGGIGSGKSTVAQCLQQLGAHVVDTDAIAHALTAPGGAAIPALREAFGSAAIDAAGALARAHMRALAFSQADVRQRLESILHPLIGLEAARRADAAGDAVVVFDVPLLVESGSRWRARVDRVLLVDCSEATQVERVMRRPGWDRVAAERVIAQQACRSDRRAAADAVLFNDGLDLDALHHEVASLWRHWSLMR